MTNNTDVLYEKINNNESYIVFGLSTCPYCKKTINFF